MTKDPVLLDMRHLSEPLRFSFLASRSPGHISCDMPRPEVGTYNSDFQRNYRRRSYEAYQVVFVIVRLVDRLRAVPAGRRTDTGKRDRDQPGRRRAETKDQRCRPEP